MMIHYLCIQKCIHITLFREFYHKHPNYKFLKVFGRACYLFVLSLNFHRSEKIRVKCVLVGYNSLYKGYLCLNKDNSSLHFSSRCLEWITFLLNLWSSLLLIQHPLLLSCLSLCTTELSLNFFHISTLTLLLSKYSTLGSLPSKIHSYHLTTLLLFLTLFLQSLPYIHKSLQPLFSNIYDFSMIIFLVYANDIIVISNYDPLIS